jgi:phospholipid transport system transporter-binding protein
VNGSSERAASLSVENGRWSLSGALTIDSAAQVLAASRAARLPGSGVVSLAGLRRVDSAAVAVLLAWRRRALQDGQSVVFSDMPSNLTALAQLYGVEQLVSPEAEGSRAPAA